jgi:uncharacterized protein (DUF1778 family)
MSFMPDAATTNTAPAQEPQTILAVRIPTDLRERIKSAAARDHRTESSFARYHLERAADEVLAAHAKAS